MIFQVILLFTAVLSVYHIQADPKKVLFLTSFGGGGNLAASNALASYIQNDYDVQSTYVFKELLKPLDPIYFLTGGYYSGEEFYNFFLPGKHFGFLGWVYALGTWYIQTQKNKIHAILRDYFLATKPDIIVSVIPIINNIVLDVAQELNIPFLLIPTDLDVSPYIVEIAHPTYKQFYIGLPFNDEEIITPLKNASLSQDQIFIIGSPLRNDFFMKKNQARLREEFGIDKNKSAIMLFMGAQGSHEMEKYIMELLKVPTPIHIIACTGKNEQSQKELAKIEIPPHISLSIVGFTDRIADYMAACDILISKSGTLSICEALYSNLPLFLDATSTLLPWEEFNHHFIEKHDFGKSIHDHSEITPIIIECINNPEQLKQYKNNIQKLEKKYCPQKFRELLKKILPQ